MGSSDEQIETSSPIPSIEDTLRESEEQYKFLVNAIQIVVIILNKNGSVQFVNKFTCTLLGFTEQEMLTKSIMDFLSPALIPKVLTILAQEFLGHPQPGLEVEVKTKSGEMKTLLFADASNIIYKNGHVTGVMASAIDITEQKKSETELKKSHDSLQAKVSELEKINAITIDRELKMIELKNKIKELEQALQEKK
jgi:PAS domain S-box-containing protein